MRLPLAVTLLLAACSGTDTATTTGGRAAEPLAPTVRDSAGIEIAEHPADAFDRAPLITMDTVPFFEFGGESAAVELSRVGRPVVLRDGRLVFYAEGTIYVVGTDGTIVEQIGRLGSGPGEFRYASITYGRGDTLVVEDIPNARVSYVVPGEGVVRDRRYALRRDGGIMSVVGGLGGDTLIANTSGFAIPDNLTGPTAVPWMTVRVDPGSEQAARVDSTDGVVLLPSARGAAVRYYEGVPAVAVTTDAVITTSGRTWSLRVLRPDGTLVRLIRVRMSRRVPDPVKVAADADSQVARYRRMIADGRFPDAADTVEMFAGIRRRPVADSLGAIGGFLRAPDDILWVRDGGYVAADSEWGYAAVRPDGTLLGRIVGPGRNKIYAFGPGVVVLRTEDDDGFATFRVHRLNGMR